MFKSGAVAEAGAAVGLEPRGNHSYRVTLADSALPQDTGVNSAPARVNFLGDPLEKTIDERLLDGFTGARKGGNFELDLIATADPRARDDQAPVKSVYRQILARGSNIDRVSFALEQSDEFQRVDANGSLRSTVTFCVIMRVTNEP